MRRNVLNVVTVCLICATCFAGAAAYAQNSFDSEDALEEIVVTGSRITRRDFSSPSPIATIDRVTLDGAAQPTLEETLNQMPQIIPDLERTANNPGDGTARINLRGLGSNRTLVLLNGRRLAPSGVDAAVDVNNLPQALVERVEIITGGATTVYGSDAVAGVVNFITRDDLGGVAVEATAYATEQGDSEIHDFNIAFGHNFSNGKGNITAYGSHYDRRSLFASERPLTAVPLVDADGMVSASGSLATPSSVVTFPLVEFGNGPARTTFDTDGLPAEFADPADRYNFAPLNYLQTPLRRTTAAIFLHYDVGESSEVYAELSFARNTSKQNLAPIPVNDLFLTNLDNPELRPETQQFFADNFSPPFLPPGTAGFFLARRLEELGPRVFDRTRDYSRLAAGLRGEFAFGWDYDLWLTYTDNDEETTLLNGASAANFQQGLFVNPATGECLDPSNNCTPLNIWGAGRLSSAGTNFLRLPELANNTAREQELLSGYLRGSLLETPAGSIDVAFGAEWRSDDGSFDADDALFTGDALGYRGTAGVDGEESVFEVYAEMLVPLLADSAAAKYLGLELGFRWSDYDKAGSVDTYKIGGEWQIVEAFRLRMMFQHSVRAPSITEAFQEQFVESFAFVGSDPDEDPCSSSADPVGNGRTDACVATGLPPVEVGVFEANVGIPTDFVRGGNPNLSPEEADTFTVGALLAFGPENNWQLSVDYFDLEIEDTIGDLEATVACFDPANTAGLFCDAFVRDPNTFDIIEVAETQVNRGGQRTTGLDTQLRLELVLPAAMAISDGDASLSANVAWTHMQQNDIRELSFGATLRCAGQFGFPCDSAADGLSYPDDRITTNFSYLSGDLGLYLNWRWIDGTGNAALRIPDFLGIPDPDLAIPRIGSRSYVDLGLGFEFSEHLRARLNISNLFDQDAPLMADAVTSNNTDTRIYDIFGRSYALTIALRY